MDDITLTFSPNMIVDALKKIHLGLENMDKSFQSFADKSKGRAEKTKVSAISIAKGLGVAQLAMSGLRKVMAQIPELGRTFSIAGSILTRNLLWPLRQELIPVLQKVLDWVRDNRAMFVRWGNIVRNIFIVIKNLVSGIVRLLKRLWDGFLSNLERGFSVSVKKMTDLANILIFKISAVVNFLIITLEPIVDIISNIFAKSAMAVSSFVEGFLEGFGDIGTVISDAMESLRDMLNLVNRLVGSGDSLSRTFKVLGIVLGTVVGGAIRTALTLFDGLILSINSAVGFVKWGVAKLKGNDREADKIRKETNMENDRLLNRIKSRAIAQKTVTDKALRNTVGLFTEGGKVDSSKRFDPTVTNNNNTASNRIVNQNITVNNRIDGSKDPRETADMVSKQLRDQLAKEKTRAGRSR